MDKSGGDIAEDQRIVILSGLVNHNSSIAAVRWVELVLSNIGDPGGEAEEESLDRNDINRVDSVDAIYISSYQPASYKGSADSEEMPLDGDDINCVDAGGAWRQRGLGRRHGVVSARWQG